jgi:nickel-dependent lactate racemase
MRIAIPYGREQVDADVPDNRVVALQRQPIVAALDNPLAAVRDALEKPLGFPALRRALTPDDHLAVVVDESLPQLSALLTCVLEHVTQARVRPEAITLVCPPSTTGQLWADHLPQEFDEIRLEVHDPEDRDRLAYLATTRQGQRVYLNRTVVDADQVVILTGRGYDPILGYSGAEGSLFPWLSDEATRMEAYGDLTMDAPTDDFAWRKLAVEVAWLMGGSSFLVQVITDASNNMLHVLGGPVETSIEGQKLLDARWRVEVAKAADVVVAAVSGDPAQQSVLDLARAFGCAARIVKPRGRIVLLSDINPTLGENTDCLREAESPDAVLTYLHNHPAADTEAAYQWASAADQATLYLLSKLPGETAEELFTVPLDHASQINRLLDAAESCVFLPDAHKTMATLAK